MKVQLHGALKELSPEPLELYADGLLQLMRALESIIPEFRQQLFEAQEYFFVRKQGDQYLCIRPEEIGFPLDTDELHIIPNVDGSGFEIAGAMVLSGMLGSVGYWVVGITLNILFSVAISAIVGALAPSPKSGGTATQAEKTPSFIFNGAVNVTNPGATLPLVYGEVLTGSVVISVGIANEDIPV